MVRTCGCRDTSAGGISVGPAHERVQAHSVGPHDLTISSGALAMFNHSATLGLIAAAALALPSGDGPSFTLASSGAVQLTATGDEAQYGMAPERVEGHRLLVISLGTTARGALVMYT